MPFPRPPVRWRLTTPSGAWSRIRSGVRGRAATVSAIAVLVAVGAVLPATAVPWQAEPRQTHRPDVLLEWYDITAATVAAAGVPTQVSNSRTWAVSWLAAARAVRPGAGRSRSRDFAEAALATAVHDGLAAQVPGRKAELDRALDRSLARIPAGPDRDRGVAAGRTQARVVLERRAGDGLDVASVNAPYTPPAPAPGAWRLTPPAFGPAVQSGQGRGEPFLLGRADRFRPGPAPALGSPRYRKDLAEIRLYGSVDSTVRTPRQTGTAKFWAQSSLSGYTGALRAMLTQLPGGLLRRVTLVAVFHTVTIDAQIAVYEAKYHYLWWRPVTAIRAADTDGDPTTAPDPAWTPLTVTPPHPEYPSGHTTYSGAAERVLTRLTGPLAPQPFTITSPTAPGITRTYRAWSELTRDNVDARVWSGIHFRTTDGIGADLGRRVAEYDLSRLADLFR